MRGFTIEKNKKMYRKYPTPQSEASFGEHFQNKK